MMSLLFTPVRMGSLEVPNRFVRSATAEKLADMEGRPQPQLASLLAELQYLVEQEAGSEEG